MTAQSPLISVVLPTYNGARYLADSVQSVIDQTYTNWELIIVDDCSTDGTAMIIAEFVTEDTRIRTVRHEENRKLPAALNTGFALSKGEYLTWTSDDNLYRPYAFRTLVEHLEEHLTAALVYSDFSLIDAKGCVVGKRIVPDYREALYRKNCIGSCFLYRRRAADVIGQYDVTKYLAEDYDYWLRMSTHFPLVRVSEDLYLHRMHESSLTSSRRKDVAPVAEQVIIRNLAQLTWVHPNEKAQTFLHLCRRARARGEYHRAVRRVVMALSSSPHFVLRRLMVSILSRIGLRRSA